MHGAGDYRAKNANCRGSNWTACHTQTGGMPAGYPHAVDLASEHDFNNEGPSQSS